MDMSYKWNYTIERLRPLHDDGVMDDADDVDDAHDADDEVMMSAKHHRHRHDDDDRSDADDGGDGVRSNCPVYFAVFAILN